MSEINNTSAVDSAVASVASVADTTKKGAKKGGTKKGGTKAAPTVPATITAYRLINMASSGAVLWSYTNAVLSILGMFDGKTTKKGNIGQFFKSSTIENHHIKNGNFEKGEKGIKLTPKGKAYFMNRLNGTNAQNIPAELAAAMLELVKTGKDSSGIIPASIVKDKVEITFTV